MLADRFEIAVEVFFVTTKNKRYLVTVSYKLVIVNCRKGECFIQSMADKNIL